MIKGLYEIIKNKIIKFVKWVVAECKNWHTILLLLVVAAVLFTPAWGGFIVGLLFDWQWGYVLATATVAVLIGPVPFWVISIAITLGIKKLFQRKHKKEEEALHEDKDTVDGPLASADAVLEAGDFTDEKTENISENN